MARLLVKNNRLAVRNGRLVSTANGAPCCCGDGPPALPCECSPNALIVSGDTYPLCIGTGQFPPYRVRTFNAFYQLISVVTTTRARLGVDFRPFPARNIREEETTQNIVSTAATKTVCYSAAGLPVLLSWRVEYQNSITSTLRGVVEQSTTVYVSQDIESYPADIVRQLLRTLNRANDAPFTERCNFQESTTETDTATFPPFDQTTTTTNTNQEQFTGSVTGGNALQSRIEVVASRKVTYPSYDLFVGTETFDRETSSIERKTWTHATDLCEGSGGGSGSRPGGCAGCGDPTRLTII